jgi:hypothetical protein
MRSSVAILVRQTVPWCSIAHRCRAQRIEPPAPSRIERLLGSAQEAFDDHFTAHIVERLSVESIARLQELVAEGGEDDGPGTRRLAAEALSLAETGGHCLSVPRLGELIRQLEQDGFGADPTEG